MKQFSLEEYLANPARKVVTRDGRNARIICTDMKSTNYPVVALVENGSGYERLDTFSKNGEYAVNESSISDLFFAPERYEGWINIYRDSDNGRVYTGRAYDSKEDAEKRKASDENYVTTIKIEWDE